MFKDKFALGIIVATIVLFLGGAYAAARLSQSRSTSQGDTSPDRQQLLAVANDDHIKGNPAARVVLVEYLDFECGVCGTYHPLIKDLLEEFGEEIIVVNRYFPLVGHRNAMNAALAVEAAGRQGKYFEMHDLLFEKQADWIGQQFSNRDLFDQYALELGLEMEQYKRDLDSPEVRERVQRDLESGQALGVNSTPTFFLNGERIPNPRSLEDFRTLIKAALLTTPKPEELVLGDKVHEHIDLKVYLSGEQLDLSQAKYQESIDNPLEPSVHLHDGNGEVVHKHRDGATLGLFFTSLGMTLREDCFITDEGKRFCNDANNELRFFVNGQANDQFANYELNDLDRVLISYGPKNVDLTEQINAVTDLSCIYSEKCPERGAPPTEGCVGGLGSDC